MCLGARLNFYIENCGNNFSAYRSEIVSSYMLYNSVFPTDQLNIGESVKWLRRLIFPGKESEYVTNLENEAVVQLVNYPPDFGGFSLFLCFFILSTGMPRVWSISLETRFHANLRIFFFLQIKLPVFPFSKVHITSVLQELQ